MARDPILGVIYGPPKVGKTTDLGYSLPRALWLAAPGATAPLESVCGYTAMRPPLDIEALDDAIKILEAIRSDGKKKLDIDGIIIDDLTLYVDRTIRMLQSQGVGSKDPRQLWGAVRMKLLVMRDTARRAGVHVLMNTHEQGPKVNSGTRVRGGPALPGAGAELIPAACDLVLRAVPNPANISIGWRVNYRCTVEDQDYVSGDRYNVTPDYSPMNIGEILRLQGFPIRRHPEMEWQEEIVAKVASALAGNLGDQTFVRKALDVAFSESMKRQPGIPTNIAERRAVWTQRDSYDRGILHAAQENHRRRLFR